MKRHFIWAVGSTLFLSACSSMLVSKTQQHMWTLNDGNAFGAKQVRCDIEMAAFVNNSNSTTSGRAVRFIATNSSGITRGEWRASCPPTVAGGTSICDVRYLGGKPLTYIAEPDGGCAEFAKFTVVN
jgi:hypothetical protein